MAPAGVPARTAPDPRLEFQFLHQRLQRLLRARVAATIEHHLDVTRTFSVVFGRSNFLLGGAVTSDGCRSALFVAGTTCAKHGKIVPLRSRLGHARGWFTLCCILLRGGNFFTGHIERASGMESSPRLSKHQLSFTARGEPVTVARRRRPGDGQYTRQFPVCRRGRSRVAGTDGPSRLERSGGGVPRGGRAASGSADVRGFGLRTRDKLPSARSKIHRLLRRLLVLRRSCLRGEGRAEGGKISRAADPVHGLSGRRGQRRRSGENLLDLGWRRLPGQGGSPEPGAFMGINPRNRTEKQPDQHLGCHASRPLARTIAATELRLTSTTWRKSAALHG